MITDRNGNVFVNSKKKRIEKKKTGSDLTEKRRKSDPTLTSLLSSYKMAVSEPDYELVHLYEIRDALSIRFGGGATACHALNISSQRWSRLGQLANREQLRQGQFRSKNPGDLRDAIGSELMEARKIACTFVEAYILFLDLS